MLNRQLNEAPHETYVTQVGSYFDVIEQSIGVGDTNKKYHISTNSCYSPSCPITNGSWTSINISPTSDNTIDLTNTFITAKFTFKLKPGTALSTASGATAQTGINKPAFWIGYKDSMDSVISYQILANGNGIYTQNDAILESYITNLATPEAVKQSDVFSKVTHSIIWDRVDGYRTGCIIEPTSTAAQDVSIDIKIDVRRFLPLYSIKYLLACFGNIELRVRFGPDALVCAPLSLEDCLQAPNLIGKVASYPKITNRFVPYTEEFTMLNTPTVASGVITAGVIENQTVTVSNFEVNSCYSYCANFGLDERVYQSLMNKYNQNALEFPIQTLTFQPMNATIPSDGSKLEATLTTVPRFVDMICFLFPENSNYKTCFDNPLFDMFHLKMGGYGVIPDIPIDTKSAAFYELVANAFNVNNDLASFNKDVMRSLTVNTAEDTGIRSYDTTNFVLALPTSTDSTFQQGQTSNTAITYQLKCQGSATNPIASTCVPIMCFLKDSVFAIQLRGAAPPVISIDEYDITSPTE